MVILREGARSGLGWSRRAAVGLVLALVALALVVRASPAHAVTDPGQTGDPDVFAASVREDSITGAVMAPLPADLLPWTGQDLLHGGPAARERLAEQPGRSGVHPVPIWSSRSTPRSCWSRPRTGTSGSAAVRALVTMCGHPRSRVL
jgi:hypothetical protein